MLRDFQEALREIYRQTAGQLDEFWRAKTGNLFSGGKVNAAAIPVDGTTITITTGGGGGSVLSSPGAAGGTVTSVALSLPALFSVSGSPVTHSGTLTASLATQAAGTVWAGPTSGGAAAPTFRALVAGDVPNLPASIITSGTMTAARLPAATSGTPGVVQPDNSTITISGGVISAATAALAALTDVAIAAPADRDQLTYRAADGKWHNLAPGAPGTIRWEPLTDGTGALIYDAGFNAIVVPMAN